MLKEIMTSDEKTTKLRIIKLSLLMALVVLAAITLIALIASEIYKKNSDGPRVPGFDITNNEVMYGLGDADTEKMLAEDGKYINFTEIKISENAHGTKGRFIAFYGEILTDGFSFRVSDPSFFGLDIYIVNWETEKEECLFNEELSRRLSDIPLRIDSETGKMDGKFTLVFEIDEECFEAIRSCSTSKPDGVEQIELYPGFRSGEKRVYFGFSSGDVEYADAI